MVFLSACSESPCSSGPEIPETINKVGLIPANTATCPFGSANEIQRWPNTGYIKVAHDESLPDVVMLYGNRAMALGWTEVECNEDLASKSVDGVTQCFLTPEQLLRLEFYTLDGTLIDIDLYRVAG